MSPDVLILTEHAGFVKKEQGSSTEGKLEGSISILLVKWACPVKLLAGAAGLEMVHSGDAWHSALLRAQAAAVGLHSGLHPPTLLSPLPLFTRKKPRGWSQ